MSRQFLSANTFFPAVPSAKSETPLNTAASLIPTTHWLRGYLLPLKHRYRALSAGRPQPSLFSPAPLAAGPARRWRGQRGRGVATRTWGEAPTRRRPAQRGTAAAWPAPAEPSRAGRPRPAPRAAGPRNAWPAAALRAGGAGRRAAEKLRRPRSAQRGGRAARGSRSRRASRPTPAPQGQDMGAGAAPNSEPLPRAAPAAGRRHRGARNHPPRPRGGHPAPAEKLTLRAAAGGGRRGAGAEGVRSGASSGGGGTRLPHAAPGRAPSFPPGERGARAQPRRGGRCRAGSDMLSPPAVAARNLPPRGGEGGREEAGGARRNRGQSWMLPRGRAKNRRRRKEQLELKGAEAASLPAGPGQGLPPRGGGWPPAAPVLPAVSEERHRNRGDACASRARVLPLRVRRDAATPAEASRAARCAARLRGGGLLGAPDGAAAGLCPPLASAPGPSPQRRAPRLRAGPVTPAPGWAVFTSGPGRLPQSGPFTSGPGHPVKRQFQKSGLESAGEDAKRYFHAVCLRRRLHPAPRCSVVWTRLEEKQTRTSLLSSEAQRSQMRMWQVEGKELAEQLPKYDLLGWQDEWHDHTFLSQTLLCFKPKGCR